MEAYKYPIFTILYHPEYKLTDYLYMCVSKGKIFKNPPLSVTQHIANETTDELAFRFGSLLNKIAREGNKNRIQP